MLIIVLGSYFSASSLVWGADEIPRAAWKRPLGLPLANAGTKKPALDAGHIDDGYWQGLRLEASEQAPSALIVGTLPVGT